MSKALKVSKDSVWIGDRQLDAHIYDPSLSDGTKIVIEATGDRRLRTPQTLFVTELRNVLAGSMPKGFQLSIYQPENYDSLVEGVQFQDVGTGPQMVLVLYRYFHKWEYRKNLIHFFDEFRSKIESGVVGCVETDSDRDEYGLRLLVHVQLESTSDLHDAYRKASDDIYRLYRESIRGAENEVAELVTRTDGTTEPEPKWWIRHVVVPILSGGAGAALVAWVLAGIQ